jgi:hypothetical protein
MGVAKEDLAPSTLTKVNLGAGIIAGKNWDIIILVCFFSMCKGLVLKLRY